MSDRASNEFDRYAKCVWRLFPILSIEDAESNLQSFRDVKSGETAQDNDSDIPCSHTSCKCDGITIPADTVNACTLFILLLGEICSPDHITTPPISTDVRIQAAKYILQLNDEEVSLSKATAYTLAAQLMDRCGQIFQRDKYVSSAICVFRHLSSSTSRLKDSASEVFHINCMIWTLVHMEMESTHMMLNWYNEAQLLGQIESNVRALDLFIAKTQLWQIMKDFQDCEAGHPKLQKTYRSKLEDWRQSLGLVHWKDPATAHLFAEYWWATIHGSLPIHDSVDTGSREGLIYAILQYLIVYRRMGPSCVPDPGIVLKRQLQCFYLLVDLLQQGPVLGDMKITLLEVKLKWPPFLRLCEKHFRKSFIHLSQWADKIIRVFEEYSYLFETVATQKPELPSGSLLPPNEERPITLDADDTSLPTTPIRARKNVDVQRQE